MAHTEEKKGGRIMDMLALKKRREQESSSHSILIYGDSGCGKTRLAATAALIPEIQRIVYLDLENGHDTILNMGLPDSALEKIQLFRICDTRKDPHVMSTMLKMFSSKDDVVLCEEHGRINCLACSKEKKPTQVFNLTKMNHNELVILDSGSQLADCGVNALLKGQPEDAILQIQEWGTVNNWLKSILQVVQIGRFTNVVVLTHVFYDEEYSGTGINKTLIRTKVYPLMGTKNFSTRCGKYFGTIVNLEVKNKRHVGGSSTTYAANVQTKSRLNIKVEAAAEISMQEILVKGGIIRPAHS